MKMIRVQFKISDELLELLDQAAAKNYVTRSEYLREAIVLRMRGSNLVKRQRDEFLERLRKLSDD